MDAAGTLDERERASVARTRRAAAARLLEERVPAGHWVGELSSSALSTATAVLALAHGLRAGVCAAEAVVPLVRAGLDWLVAHQNDDGGYGDTVDSPSNPSTTTLAWVALGDAVGAVTERAAATAAAERAGGWLEQHLGTRSPDGLAQALLAAYGDDRTFSVPILVTCALGGRLGRGAEAWRALPAIPFELAALPHGLFRFLRLPMVSYALPALIAIGQVIHHHRPTRVPGLRQLRNGLRTRTLAKLEAIQPSSGGFLEATPLTSFVALSLIGCGQAGHPVVRAGLDFLERSARPDGSWPIDTNLATWTTTLAVGALAAGDGLDGYLPEPERAPVRRWLEHQQYREVHLYTQAAPGGWAWTDLPGGVPDADDTPGALLALAALRGGDPDSRAAAATWLLDLQNGDGGMPTFCRGWGQLPFDRSSPDLTAHALRAFAALELEAQAGLDSELRRRLARSRRAAVRYLERAQRQDGSFVPLWFGNQREPGLENPLYGTARVLLARAALEAEGADQALDRAVRWLLAAQARDGGFGGAPGLEPTVEETALALEALAELAQHPPAPDSPRALVGELRRALGAAALWLARATDEGTRFPASPIGLYFAKLWYAERLYPLLFTVAALERAARTLDAP